MPKNSLSLWVQKVDLVGQLYRLAGDRERFRIERLRQKHPVADVQHVSRFDVHRPRAGRHEGCDLLRIDGAYLQVPFVLGGEREEKVLPVGKEERPRLVRVGRTVVRERADLLRFRSSRAQQVPPLVTGVLGHLEQNRSVRRPGSDPPSS